MEPSNRQLEEASAAYLAALLAGDRTAALVIAREALTAGVPLCTLYRRVIQPAMYATGKLWEQGQLDVGGEHLATVITRGVMEVCASKLRPRLSRPPAVIAASVGAELHDVGLRMVADCLELDGWNTLYLGANTPVEAIVALAVRHRVAVVAASVTMTENLKAVRSLADMLRQSPIGPTARLLVGGQPFNRVPELWERVGADGMATDMAQAVEWLRAHVRVAQAD